MLENLVAIYKDKKYDIRFYTICDGIKYYSLYNIPYLVNEDILTIKLEENKTPATKVGVFIKSEKRLIIFMSIIIYKSFKKLFNILKQT